MSGVDLSQINLDDGVVQTSVSTSYTAKVTVTAAGSASRQDTLQVLANKLDQLAEDLRGVLRREAERP